MGEVHEGICCTHQSAPKMKWLLRRASFYWPTMLSDCFRYFKGCEECQWFARCVDTSYYQTMVVPRLKIEVHCQINPPSSKRHCFMLVATYYFTKWTEAVSLKDIIHSRDCIYSGLSHLHKMTRPIYDIVLESKT